MPHLSLSCQGVACGHARECAAHEYLQTRSWDVTLQTAGHEVAAARPGRQADRQTGSINVEAVPACLLSVLLRTSNMSFEPSCQSNGKREALQVQYCIK